MQKKIPLWSVKALTAPLATWLKTDGNWLDWGGAHNVSICLHKFVQFKPLKSANSNNYACNK